MMILAVKICLSSLSCSNPPRHPQLRCVFDACDTTGSGLISLRQLANISRSHVNGATQVLAKSKLHFCRRAPIINQLLCFYRWNRSWIYSILGETGLRMTNSISVDSIRRFVAEITFYEFEKLNIF